VSKVKIFYQTNNMAAEPAGSSPLTPEPATGYDSHNRSLKTHASFIAHPPHTSKWTFLQVQRFPHQHFVCITSL